MLVGKDHLPHHADDLDFLVVGQRGNGRGEAVEVDGVAIAARGLGDELVDFGVAQFVVIDQRAAQGLALLGLDLAVDGGEVDEQRRDRELGVMGVEGLVRAGKEAGNGLEHGVSPYWLSDNA